MYSLGCKLIQLAVALISSPEKEKKKRERKKYTYLWVPFWQMMVGHDEKFISVYRIAFWKWLNHLLNPWFSDRKDSSWHLKHQTTWFLLSVNSLSTHRPEFQLLLGRIIVMQSIQVSVELDCSITAFPSEHIHFTDWILWLFFCFDFFPCFCCVLRNMNDIFSVVGFWGLVLVKKGCADSHCWNVLGT